MSNGWKLIEWPQAGGALWIAFWQEGRGYSFPREVSRQPKEDRASILSDVKAGEVEALCSAARLAELEAACA